MKKLLAMFFFVFVLCSTAQASWFFYQDAGIAENPPSQGWKVIDDPRELTAQTLPREGGTFWFKTNIEVDREIKVDQATAFQIGLYSCADEVFWDGQLIGSSGFLKDAVTGTKQRKRTYLVPSSLLNVGSHDVLIRLYKRSDDVKKLILDLPRVSDYPSAMTEKERDYLRTSDLPLMSAIILLWLGCYFFLFYFFHKSFRQYFYFSISCTLVSIYLFFDGWKLQELGVSYFVSNKIVFIVGMWVIYSLSRFFQILLKYPRVGLHRFEAPIMTVISFCILISPTLEKTEKILVLWFPLLLFNVFYFGFHLFRSVYAEKKLSNFLVMATYIGVVVTISYDVYVFLFIGNTTAISPFAFLIFALGIAVQLTRDYGAALNDRNIQSDVRKKSQDLEATFHTDSLTNVHNRRSFEIFSKEAASKNEQICMAIMDVDHFKIYNDTYGHPAGDRLLISLGWLLNQWKSPNDTVYRIGGEEFVIVMRNRNAESCVQQMQRLRTLVETFPFDNLNGNGKHVTVSMGAAMPSDHIANPDKLYAIADKKLYEAKKDRNTVVFSN